MSLLVIVIGWSVAMILYFTGTVEHPVYYFLFGYIVAELAIWVRNEKA